MSVVMRPLMWASKSAPIPRKTANLSAENRRAVGRTVSEEPSTTLAMTLCLKCDAEQAFFVSLGERWTIWDEPMNPVRRLSPLARNCEALFPALWAGWQKVRRSTYQPVFLMPPVSGCL